MGRDYASVLGPLAFFTVMMRGLVHGAGLESTFLSASIHLFGFALIGYMVGQLAGWIMFDCARAKIEAEVAAQRLMASQTAVAAK